MRQEGPEGSPKGLGGTEAVHSTPGGRALPNVD